MALPELLKEANDAQALYANPTPLIGAALIYLVFLWPMVRLVGWLETRFHDREDALTSRPLRDPLEFQNCISRRLP